MAVLPVDIDVVGLSGSAVSLVVEKVSNVMVGTNVLTDADVGSCGGSVLTFTEVVTVDICEDVFKSVLVTGIVISVDVCSGSTLVIEVIGESVVDEWAV